MSLAYKQVKVYVRITVVVLIVLVFAIVLFMNRHHTVKFWFFGLTDGEKEINVVWLVLSTAAASKTIWWAFSFTLSLRRDLKELKRQREQQEIEMKQAAKARDLEARERQLAQKMQVPATTDADGSALEQL